MANTAPDAMKMTAFSLTHGVISEAEKKKKNLLHSSTQLRLFPQWLLPFF